MKKLSEDTKITLTIGQLKRLVKEANNSDVEIPSADEENMRPVKVSKEEMKQRFNDPAVKEILSKYGIHVTFYKSDYCSVVLYLPLKDNTPVDPNDKYSVIRKLRLDMEKPMEKVINELDKNSDVFFSGHDWSDRDHYDNAWGHADIKTIQEVMHNETKYEFEPFYGCWGELSSFISSGYNYIWYTEIENKIKKYGQSTDKKLEDELGKMAEYAQEVLGDEYLVKVQTGRRGFDSSDKTAIVIYGGQKRDIDQIGYMIFSQNKFGDCRCEVKHRNPQDIDLNDWKADIKEFALDIVS